MRASPAQAGASTRRSRAGPLRPSPPKAERSLQKVFLWPCLILYCAVFARTGWWLVDRWTMSIWHNCHGFLVPFVAAFLAGGILRQDKVADRQSSAWGFLFLVPALLLLAADSAINTGLLSALALLFSLPGLSLLFLGARRTRMLAFPWLITFFMLPIPSVFVEGLQRLLSRVSAAGAEELLRAAGMSVYREGQILHLARNTLEVADACSGFSTLYASAALAVVLASLITRWPRRMLLLLAVAPCAVACNIGRCALLAWMVHAYGEEILRTSWHTATGVFSFAASSALLLALAPSPGSPAARRRQE